MQEFFFCHSREGGNPFRLQRNFSHAVEAGEVFEDFERGIGEALADGVFEGFGL